MVNPSVMLILETRRVNYSKLRSATKLKDESFFKKS